MPQQTFMLGKPMGRNRPKVGTFGKCLGEVWLWHSLLGECLGQVWMPNSNLGKPLARVGPIIILGEVYLALFRGKLTSALRLRDM